MKLPRWLRHDWEWNPSPREIAQVSLALAVVFYALGLFAFFSPARASYFAFFGDWREMFFKAFGEFGDLLLFAGVGTAFLLFGLLKYRKT